MITKLEREEFLTFIERNTANAPPDFDEGIGTVYERIVINDYFRTIQGKYGIQSVLETPADGVTGVPGIGSLEFARNGADVWLTSPSQRLLDKAKEVWEQKGLIDRVRFAHCEVDRLPFPDRHFDLVWNYCIFERFTDPDILVAEMKRVSGKYILLITQNRYNSGTPIHRLYHKFHRLKWDHGRLNLMTMKGILASVRRNGLGVLEAGAIDIPPCMDTWDMPLRGELKRILSIVGRKWEWRLEEREGSEQSRMLSFTIGLDASLPQWFRLFQAHHLYVLSEI